MQRGSDVPKESLKGCGRQPITKNPSTYRCTLLQLSDKYNIARARIPPPTKKIAQRKTCPPAKKNANGAAKNTQKKPREPRIIFRSKRRVGNKTSEN